jgi:integrase
MCLELWFTKHHGKHPLLRQENWTMLATDAYTPKFWAIKAERGVYMGGTVVSDVKGGRCACGGKYSQVDMFGYSVPQCPKCKGHPHLLRIVRYLPSLDGKGRIAFIRYDHKQDRLTSIIKAIATMEQIDAEIKNKKFDPRQYASRLVAEQLKLDSFVRTHYRPLQEARLKRGEISPGGARDKNELYDNHLKGAFGDLDMRYVGVSHIKTFRDGYTDRLRTRDKATAELRCILTEARAHELIDKLPPFPKLAATRTRDPDNILSPEEVERVCMCVDNPTYQRMIRALWIYPIRESDLRAMQWRDILHDEGVVVIRRHFSDGNKLVQGRKSQHEGAPGAIHYLPLAPEFLALLEGLPRPLNKQEFIFKGARGAHVSGNVLRISWNKAKKKAGIKRAVELYDGTKHSRVTYWKALGWTDETIAQLCGTSVKMVRRYAHVDKKKQAQKAVKIMGRG